MRGKVGKETPKKKMDFTYFYVVTLDIYRISLKILNFLISILTIHRLNSILTSCIKMEVDSEIQSRILLTLIIQFVFFF